MKVAPFICLYYMSSAERSAGGGNDHHNRENFILYLKRVLLCELVLLNFSRDDESLTEKITQEYNQCREKMLLFRSELPLQEVIEIEKSIRKKFEDMQELKILAQLFSEIGDQELLDIKIYSCLLSKKTKNQSGKT